MSRIVILILLISTTLGCRRDITELAPHATASVGGLELPRRAPGKKVIKIPAKPVNVAVAAPRIEATADEPVQAPMPPAAWSADPPHAGVDLDFERVDLDRIRVTGKRIAFELPIPELGDCVEEVSQIVAPQLMPDAKMRDRPVWLALHGDGEAASIRLSTRGALFVINDGCMRTADISPMLVGTTAGSSDPIFAADPLAPESAHHSNEIDYRRQGWTKSVIRKDKKPFIELKHFHAERMLTPSAIEDHQWIRMSIDREWEYAKHDGSIGREYTLIWTLDEGERPQLVMENDHRYGSEGRDRQEGWANSKRRRHHPEGVFEAIGTQKTIEYAELYPKQRCETADAGLAYRYHDESVRWTFRAKNSKRARTLGTATLRAEFASDCVREAGADVKKRQVFLERAPKSPVRWKYVGRD